SALVSGSEVAFFGLSPADIKEAEEAKTGKGKVVVQLLDRPKKLMATILIANNAINIGAVLLFNKIGDTLFADLHLLLFGLVPVRFLVEVAVITFSILLFGEILPKVYADRNKFTFAFFMAYPLQVLNLLFSPLNLPMRKVNLYMQDK